MDPTTGFRLVTKADAAAVFGVCVRTIDNYINEGLLPRPVQFASKEFWHPESFQAFIDRTFREPASNTEEQSSAQQVPDRPTMKSGPKRTDTPAAHPAARALARQNLTLNRLNTGS